MNIFTLGSQSFKAAVSVVPIFTEHSNIFAFVIDVIVNEKLVDILALSHTTTDGYKYIGIRVIHKWRWNLIQEKT